MQYEAPWLISGLAFDVDDRSGLASLEIVSALSGLLLAPASLDIVSSVNNIRFESFVIGLKGDQHELVGRAAFLAAEIIRLAIDSMSNLCSESDKQRIRGGLSHFVAHVRECCSHALTCAQLSEAKKRRIPVFLIDPALRLYQLGSGSSGRWLSSTANDGDSYIGTTLARNKSKMRNILVLLGLPVPREVNVSLNATDHQLEAAARSIGFPCVLKPIDQEKGLGATASIETLSELVAAFRYAKKHARAGIILQNHISGHDYRLNMVNGCLQFVIKRSVPILTGNGLDSVNDLLLNFNSVRRSLGLVDGISKPIDLDDLDLINRLEKTGLTMESVLEDGRTVNLRGNANASTGGLYEELDPMHVHPRIQRQCEAVAKTLRLDICGIDYICHDISADPAISPGAYIEVNSMPQNSPKRASSLLDNLFRDIPNPHIPCVVLMSAWQLERRGELGEFLGSYLKKYPRAILAIPREAESLIAPLLSADMHARIHIFSHPREPLLDRSSESVIYLVTPHLVMAKGIPGLMYQEFKVLDPAASLTPKHLWEPFLLRCCKSDQTNLA